MAKKQQGIVTIPVLGLLLLGGAGGFGAISYFQLKDLVDKGYIVLDVSDNVPSYIRAIFHATGWLPKEIPVKYIVKAMSADPGERTRYTALIDNITKYVSVRVKKH